MKIIFKRLWLFSRIVWRQCEYDNRTDKPLYLDWKTAWKVANIIHYKKATGSLLDGKEHKETVK